MQTEIRQTSQFGKIGLAHTLHISKVKALLGYISKENKSSRRDASSTHHCSISTLKIL